MCQRTRSEFSLSGDGRDAVDDCDQRQKPQKLLIALVNGGALLDYRTKDGSTALHRAVEKDCYEAVS